jgi:protoporphyrinogen oxidase
LNSAVLIIGAGPAGLTAAYELSKSGVASTILEADNVVGGIARTAEYKGYCFDVGGHRFFTKVSLVEEMWREVLGEDLVTRPRLSRIYYRSKFFQYPIEPMNALMGLGMWESARCAISYLIAQVFPQKPENNFEVWVSNRFGRRLFQIFFKSYTEKVWGIPCQEIGADWAAQRIRGLSFKSLVWDALRPRTKDKSKVIKSLINEFLYPRKGPGMMWTRTRAIVESRRSKVVMGSRAEMIRWEPGRVLSVTAGGVEYPAEHFISTMPIRDLMNALDPAPPAAVLAAGRDLKYRDFLTTCLICRGGKLFPDNWIYIHDPMVKVGRIQNYGNWSPEMVPDPGMSCLGMEYFCFEGDDLWNSRDEDLIAMSRSEIEKLGLARAADVVDATVLRMPKAYPVYDATYQHSLTVVREFLSKLPNLQLVGRNGMHRYNNQDHSMLTAILAARNILGGKYDLWQVNADSDYAEEGSEISESELKALEKSQPMVPRRVEAMTGK